MHTLSWHLSSKKNDNNWKECGIFCLCLPQGSLIEQNYIKNSVRQLLKSSSTFCMKFFVIISRLLKKKNMKYPIHFFATFPRNFIKTVTDWGEVPWLSKDFCSCYKIIRHERSMLFIAWLVFFSFFFISFVRCKMLTPRSASSKAVIIHAPGYGVGYSWGEKQFE